MSMKKGEAMSKRIPEQHPRYQSLITREKLTQAMKKGLVHETGLIAHGRGEAFDYLLGETTVPIAAEAEKTAAASLLLADDPLISVNGNVAALAASECVDLADTISGKLEVNLFHRSEKRIELIIEELEKHGADEMYGRKGDARIPGLDHDRGICDMEGIFSCDTILVPLEDGDRCQALKNMDKTVIAIDLNPLSRTAKTADITIVDNVVRAIPNIMEWAKKLEQENRDMLLESEGSWDNQQMLQELLSFLSKRLNSLF